MQQLAFDPDDCFLCSFDISSLFTNVPLAETIQICADTLYDGDLSPPQFSKEIFIELMNIATTSAEFSFNNVMYKQIDGVTMGSPLGPALANIFVGYHENKLFQTINEPFFYTRYVDDTFSIFRTEADADQFFLALNSLHPALKFTMEKEADQALSFLDVKVDKSEKQFLTSIYRKPTFTGRYMRWDSFAPSKRKTNLIETLVHRALVICSPGKVKQELDCIRSILQELDCIRSILKNNGYPETIINFSISKKISRFRLLPKEGPKKCPVYLKLPWIGNISRKFEKQVKSNVQNCFRAVDPRVIFQTRKILPSIYKDAVPITHQSMVVYQYVCRCDCRYVGRTSLRLQDRINQHIPKSIRNIENPTKVLPKRNCKITTPLNQLDCDSAIGLHLIQHPDCASHYHIDQFSVLAKARTIFHLGALEATFIKTLKPILCRQKEFVYSLQILQ